MRARPRHLLRFTTSLIGGVLVNVAIAWMLAITVDVYRVTPGGGMALYDDTHWSTTAYVRIGSLVANSTWRYRLNAGQTQTNPIDFVPTRMPNRDPGEALQRGEIVESQCTIDARGWPLLSMWSSVRRMTADGEHKVVESAGVEGGIETGLAPWVIVAARAGNRPAITQPRILPLRPVWSGFIINSTIFGLTLWLAIFGWRDARAIARVRRGRCGACGYPAGQSTSCTECGAAIPPAPATAP